MNDTPESTKLLATMHGNAASVSDTMHRRIHIDCADGLSAHLTLTEDGEPETGGYIINAALEEQEISDKEADAICAYYDAVVAGHIMFVGDERPELQRIPPAKQQPVGDRHQFDTPLATDTDE